MSTHGRSERSFSIRFVRRLPCQVEFDKSILNKLQSKYSQMASAAKGVPSEKVSEIKLNLPPRRCCAALNALTTVYYGLLGPAAGRQQSNHSLKGSTAACLPYRGLTRRFHIPSAQELEAQLLATDEDGNAKPRHDPNLEPDLTEEEEEERRAKRAKLSAPVSDGISLYCAPRTP